jgi:hypothetical protein
LNYASQTGKVLRRSVQLHQLRPRPEWKQDAVRATPPKQPSFVAAQVSEFPPISQTLQNVTRILPETGEQNVSLNKLHAWGGRL